jgi:hypothetical protein
MSTFSTILGDERECREGTLQRVHRGGAAENDIHPRGAREPRQARARRGELPAEGPETRGALRSRLGWRGCSGRLR